MAPKSPRSSLCTQTRLVTPRKTGCHMPGMGISTQRLLLSGGGDIWFFFFFFFFAHFHFPASGQAVVTGVIPSPPRFLPTIFIAHRVQQSHCSSIFHWVLLTHALALSASQFVHKKKSQRIYTSMHSAGLELTKLTYPRLEDNLIRHRGDRLPYTSTRQQWNFSSCTTGVLRTCSSFVFSFPKKSFWGGYDMLRNTCVKIRPRKACNHPNFKIIWMGFVW